MLFVFLLTRTPMQAQIWTASPTAETMEAASWFWVVFPTTAASTTRLLRRRRPTEHISLPRLLLLTARA
ncbi:MAG: hypothetical protein CL798_06390 [Chromatiales bacterium]|nr:hypothetical protein [Chromatiales bacterium]